MAQFQYHLTIWRDGGLSTLYHDNSWFVIYIYRERERKRERRLLLVLEVRQLSSGCSVSTSSISDNLFSAQGDTPAGSFVNYDHELFCLLHSLPMDNSTPEQTDISADTLTGRNIKNKSISGSDTFLLILGTLVRKKYLVQV